MTRCARTGLLRRSNKMYLYSIASSAIRNLRNFTNQDKKINPVMFDTENELDEALENDRLLAGLGGEIELRELFARHPAARIKLKLCLVGEQKDQIAIAVRPDAPNLTAWIDVVLDNVGLQLKPSGIFTLGTDWTF